MGGGITPAYTGKSRVGRKAEDLYEDHPRIHGEKSIFVGLSDAGYRITPAYTGKRTPYCCYWIKFEDHPRIHGEK